ncbi:MAG: DNA-binding protein WhiA [Clostridia bacterium]
MSFASDVRKELAKVPMEKKCCAQAELLGAILASGGLHFKGLGRYGISVNVDSGETAQRYLSLFKRFEHVSCEMTASETARLGGQTRYQVTPEESDVPLVLRSLRLIDKAQPFGLRHEPAPEMIKGECCARSFLRGAYLAGGSTGNPEHAYHLEIAVGDETLAQALVKLLEGMGVLAKYTNRKGTFVVYIKEGAYMAQVLTLMGAHKALMDFENLRIVKEVRNEVNRQMNCDSANTDKAILAAEKQISIITTIERRRGLSILPAPLRAIAELRLKYPDASLMELGELLEPKLGKSGVNARMRKLEALAESLVNEEQAPLL